MLLLGIAVAAVILAVVCCIGHPVWMAPIYFVAWFLALFVAAVIFILVACMVVNKERPQEKDSKFYRVLARLYISAIVSIARVHLETQGVEKLPKDGRFLMVCNHINDVDPGILLHCFPKAQLAFIAKREIKDMFAIGAVLHKLQCQLINRENDREALKTILKCIQIIKEDRASVAVFPEGYVSIDGKLRHFRSGVLKIAQKANVPIVVCTLKGTKTVLPNLCKLKPSYVQMHLVNVISAEEVKAANTVDLAETIYEMMIADMGEEYRSDEKAMHPDLQKERLGI